MLREFSFIGDPQNVYDTYMQERCRPTSCLIQIDVVCFLWTTGKIILEAAILTSVVVVSLTLYTFWAVKRGSDFSFLGPFLFASFLVLMAFGLIQVLTWGALIISNFFFHSLSLYTYIELD